MKQALPGWLSFALVAFVLALPSRAQDPFTGIDPYIETAQREFQVPGLAIAVVKDDQVVLARAYGTTQFGHDAPVKTGTVFSIASCTKSFTAASIAMLVDEGLLNWDDPVRKHLPDFRVADPYATEHLTIRDLLCHRTGLVRGDLIGISGGFTHEQALQRIQLLPQARPLRTGVTYHNLMYTVLGEVIEKKTGRTWHDFVSNRILTPLQMTSTATSRQSVPADQLAVRHRLYDGTLATLRTPEFRHMDPAGAIHSNINDMATWLRLQLREGELDDKPLIKKSSLREMHSLHQSIPVKWRPDASVHNARFVGTGLGWYVRDYRGHKVVQHGGAWGAEMALVPELGLGIVSLSNRDWNGLVWMLSFDVIDAYLDGPDQTWTRGTKWEFWLQHGGPDAADRDRRTELADMQKKRAPATRPSRPVVDFAGTYQSPLYPDLTITPQGDRLHVQFGDYAATLQHWEHDSFYAHSVIEPFMDWLVQFSSDAQRLEIVNIGWKDPDERFFFTRRAEQ